MDALEQEFIKHGHKQGDARLGKAKGKLGTDTIYLAFLGLHTGVDASNRLREFREYEESFLPTPEEPVMSFNNRIFNAVILAIISRSVDLEYKAVLSKKYRETSPIY